jgi:hypothetical protein
MGQIVPFERTSRARSVPARAPNPRIVNRLRGLLLEAERGRIVRLKVCATFYDGTYAKSKDPPQDE